MKILLFLVPPTPILKNVAQASRWISVEWTINEPTYVQSFDVFLNGNAVKNVDKKTRSFIYRNLLPYRK